MYQKIIALVCAAALAISLSACGGAAPSYPALTLETSSSASGGEGPVRKAPDSSNYQDDLVGLLTYMEDGKAVARDTEGVTIDKNTVTISEGVTTFTQMAYQEIGAVDGYRYQFLYNKSMVQAEFYEFDPDDLNDRAKACIDSVREKGYFELLDNEVHAVLHPSEKYLMIYTDGEAGKKDENTAQKEWAQELFLGFQGGAGK